MQLLQRRWTAHLAQRPPLLLIAVALGLVAGLLTGAATAALTPVYAVAAVLGLLAAVALLANVQAGLLAFVAVVGSLLVSYVRARAEALGVALTDGLFTRPERVLVLSVALMLGWLRLALWLLAVLTVLTAVQRVLIAVHALRDPPPA